MKIPKIILILVIIALLFVSCDDAMPLDPEDAELIAVAGFFASYFPVLITTGEIGDGGLNRFSFNDLEGISLDGVDPDIIVTWTNFDVRKVRNFLEDNGFDNPQNFIINALFEFTDGFDVGQLLITSGNAQATEIGDTIVVNANFKLKIDVDIADSPKGTFNVRYKLIVEDGDFEMEEIYVNDQKFDFDFDPDE